MGLGKTIQAIGVINASPRPKKVLVVAPASLKLNWKRELEKWLTYPLTVGVAGNELPDTDIVILNYDVLGKFKDKLMSASWDILIADEAHYAKNPKAQRTINLVGAEKKIGGKYVKVPGIADKAKRKIFLTGTPILNRPIELWPIVSTLTPGTFPNFISFAKRYANAQEGRYGWDFSGASNLGELQDKLRATIMVRRMKKDVLTELPTKRRQVIELEPDSKARKVVEREQELSKKHETELIKLRVAAELAKTSGSDDDYESAVARLRTASRVAFDEISKERHDVALAKVPQVIEHLKDVLEQQDKVVVFAHHRDVIDQIMAAFPGEAVKLTGEDSIDERQKSVDAFQTDPNVKIFVGSIHAAGVGITLTAASHVVFAELDWVPGNITQAEDRLHRIGQTNTVLVQHLVFDESLDAKIVKTLVEKQAVIAEALDVEPPPIAPIDEPATKSVSRKAISGYEDLAEEQLAQVRSAVRFLAGVDDGAIVRDRSGYNKIDTMLGQQLASLPHLTQSQAKLGAILVHKYSGQLQTAGLAVPEMPKRKLSTGAITKTSIKAEEISKAPDNPSVTAAEAVATPASKPEPFVLALSGLSEDWKIKPKRIVHNAEKGKFIITFPYDASLVSAVKSIPGVHFNSDPKNWDLSDTAADTATIKSMLKFAKDNDFVFSPGARDTIKTIVESAGGSMVAEEKQTKKQVAHEQVAHEQVAHEQVAAPSTLSGLQAINDQRSARSRTQDDRLSNKRTIDADDEQRVKSWLRDPSNADVRGVDTPKADTTKKDNKSSRTKYTVGKRTTKRGGSQGDPSSTLGGIRL
jgi:SWI/SNF-related matrix-associated actin-dependent regulator 1 of chromatin subfamily A